jgi:hypothetical protein
MNKPIELEFSPPITRYESTAKYKNSKGQQFLIRVIGCDKAEVEQRTKNFRFSCEVSTSESEKSPQDTDFPKNKYKTTGLSTEARKISDDEISNTRIKELNYFVDSVDIIDKEILQNFQVEFGNDMPEQTLDEDQPQTVFDNFKDAFIVQKINGVVRARITVTRDFATFTLWESPYKMAPNEQWVPVDSVFISVSGNSPGTGELRHSVAANKYFKITVEGKTGTQYRIKGDWDVN